MVVATLATFQLVAGGIAALPFIIHRLRVGKWAGQSTLALPDVEPQDLPQMTLVIPAWNEELLIEDKLSALAQQEYPRHKLEAIFIDSASTDNTVDLVKTWLVENPTAFADFIIIEMEKRLGKTAAIAQAFGSAALSSEILVMTDVDARLDPGSLLRLGAWFSNPEIGAVGATPQRFTTNSGGTGAGAGTDVSRVTSGGHGLTEKIYRDMFTIQRLGESARDSTPFLEGSLLGIRRTVYSDSTLDTNSNADDAQLAVAARLAGLRAIQDPALIFREPIPPTYGEHKEQKVRRAQGLQRLLWRNRSHWFSRNQGAWGGIMGVQGIMHLLIPWIVLAGCVFAVLKWCLILTGLELNIFIITTLVIDGWVFGSWLLHRFALRLPLTSLPATFLDSMNALLIAQFKLLSGDSMHLWEQGVGVRKAWLEEK